MTFIEKKHPVSGMDVGAGSWQTRVQRIYHYFCSQQCKQDLDLSFAKLCTASNSTTCEISSERSSDTNSSHVGSSTALGRRHHSRVSHTMELLMENLALRQQLAVFKRRNSPFDATTPRCARIAITRATVRRHAVQLS